MIENLKDFVKYGLPENLLDRVVFAARIGSHNYNLNDENSDEDYKIFIIPTFEDLLNGKTTSLSFSSGDVDFEVKDIRSLSKLFEQANTSYLEILYSDKLIYRTKEFDLLSRLFSIREEIVSGNLQKLFNSTLGTILQKHKNLYKGTINTKHLIDGFGYDPKQLSHMVRLSDLLYTYYNTKDYLSALRYEAGTHHGKYNRGALLEIKRGKKYDLGKVEDFAQKIINETKELEVKFNKPKTNIYDEVNKIILSYVKNNI